jgi:hypothetical protein
MRNRCRGKVFTVSLPRNGLHNIVVYSPIAKQRFHTWYCSLLKAICPEWPTGVTPFLIFRRLWLVLPSSPWLGFHGDVFPTALAAPSLRPLVPNGSLVGCQSVQFYHHLPSVGEAKSSESCQCSHIYGSYTVCRLFFRFWHQYAWFRGDYTRRMDWWMDLFTTYTRQSELEVFTALSLISTIHKSPHHPLNIFPACCSFISRFLATAFNSGNSSASRVQVLSLQSPLQNSTLNWKLTTNRLAPIPFLITTSHGLRRKYRFQQ